MAKIKLSGGGEYTPIPEGTTIFKILTADYDQDFGKLEFSMVTQSGKKHTERFSLVRDNGETNDGALRAFSFFARKVLDQGFVEEIDHEELVGKFVRADVKHTVQTNKNDPKKTVTFVNLTNYEAASGFGNEKAEVVSDPEMDKAIDTLFDDL